jgi:hypothetical protein
MQDACVAAMRWLCVLAVHVCMQPHNQLQTPCMQPVGAAQHAA